MPGGEDDGEGDAEKPPRSRGGRSGLTVPVFRVGLGVVRLQLRPGGPGDDRPGGLFGVLGLSLDLRHRRDLIAGMGVCPVRAGHASLCHVDHL